MRIAKILSFPIGGRNAYPTESYSGIQPPKAETGAFWLLPGEAGDNSEILFWFRGEDPLNSSPKIVDVENFNLKSRISLRQVTIIEGVGPEIAVMGHAIFKDEWDTKCTQRRITLIDSNLSMNEANDLRLFLESEPALATAKPTIRLTENGRLRNSVSNPVLLGLE